MSSVGNHSPGESFLSKIDIFKPTARNNSAEKTSSEAITLWGGVKISCLPESLNFGLRKIHDSIYYALPHAGKAMSNFYGPETFTNFWQSLTLKDTVPGFKDEYYKEIRPISSDPNTNIPRVTQPYSSYHKFMNGCVLSNDKKIDDVNEIFRQTKPETLKELIKSSYNDWVSEKLCSYNSNKNNNNKPLIANGVEKLRSQFLSDFEKKLSALEPMNMDSVTQLWNTHTNPYACNEIENSVNKAAEDHKTTRKYLIAFQNNVLQKWQKEQPDWEKLTPSDNQKYQVLRSIWANVDNIKGSFDSGNEKLAVACLAEMKLRLQAYDAYSKGAKKEGDQYIESANEVRDEYKNWTSS